LAVLEEMGRPFLALKSQMPVWTKPHKASGNEVEVGQRTSITVLGSQGLSVGDDSQDDADVAADGGGGGGDEPM
jgi:hypothetical protein